jgi:HSP20 family protein
MNDVTKTEEKPRTIAPEANVIEEVGKMTVKMEMPGVSKANLDIQVKGQEVTVVGRRQDEVVEGTWLLRERRRGDFQKTYSVDGSIDLDKIEASLNNGILTLTLPMKEAAKPRRIEIKSA